MLPKTEIATYIILYIGVVTLHVLFSLENCYYFIRPKVQEIVGPGCMITPFFGFLLLKTISD